MPNTGEDREIKRRVNANEAEVVRESKKLVQKAKADLNTQKKDQAHGHVGARKLGNDRMVPQEATVQP